MFFKKNKNEQARKSSRAESITKLLIVLGILLAINIIGNYFFFQLDFTEDKRYTLTSGTKDLIKNLDDVVMVEVLMEGDYPSMFKRLQTAVREILNDFKSYSGFIEFRFVNPLEGSAEDVKAAQENLRKMGMNAVNLSEGDAGETKFKVVYPYAVVTYKTRQPIVVDLLENKTATASQEQIINNSVNLLEYKFTNAIQRLQLREKPVVAFTTGHGELDSLRISDFKNSLSQFYSVGDINIGADNRPSINVLKPYRDTSFVNPDGTKGKTAFDTVKVDVLVVAKPLGSFSEPEKFEIDQYVMRGGKVVWLIDAMNAELDSVNRYPDFFARDYPHNLDDMLFRYGARINKDVVSDLTSSKIPLVVGMMGNEPQTKLFNWWYFPIAFSPDSKHPIVKALDGVDTRFPSSIDTIRTKTNVKKTVLLASSKNSTLRLSPLEFHRLGEVQKTPKWNKSNIPLAVLLEGEFSSLYENRVSPRMDSMLRSINMPFIAQSTPTAMIVVSDGDIAASSTRYNDAFPLGFNRFENYTYGNKDFLFNCIEYLLDKKGIAASRTKEAKLRLLDKVAIKEGRTYYQFINVVLPILILALFGFIFNFLRKRKYAKA
jgi:ABC-2 type transport system permease protein